MSASSAAHRAPGRARSRPTSQRADAVLFDCDAAFERHAAAAVADVLPVLHRPGRASVDDVFLRDVADALDVALAAARAQFPLIVDDLLAAAREQFPLIVDELRALPTDRVVVAERNALLPSLLRAIDVPPGHAIRLVPTDEVRRQRYAARAWAADVLAQSSRPDDAWETWMARDGAFAALVLREAADAGYVWLTADGSHSVAETAAIVVAHLGLA